MVEPLSIQLEEKGRLPLPEGFREKHNLKEEMRCISLI
jgi:DNA-binding transcriptional regulator/RsmH inhibitor MraZ